MSEVTDLSQGTVLIAETTGWRYQVRSINQDDNQLVVDGPHGPLTAKYDEVKQDIDDGQITVEQ